MNLVLEYIHYRWKANKKSKFSTETEARIKNCISQANVKLAFESELEFFRSKSRHERRQIEITDFGAGSKKLGSRRSIQDIYRNNLSSKRFQRIIYNLIREFKCVSILEMGTSLGFTTAYLGKSSPNGHVKTIEACPNVAREARNLFSNLKLQNVELIESSFKKYFESYPIESFDFIFIDGHHDGDALLEYMDLLLKNCSSNCLFVLDDIRWSSSMLSAWNNLIHRAEFEVHLDLFRMGILYYSTSNR